MTELTAERPRIEHAATDLVLDALRLWHADRFDPVCFRLLEALARRAAAHRGEARRMIERRLAAALADFEQRFDAAERRGREALERGTARFPHAQEDLKRLHAQGDFAALQRALARLEAAGSERPLADLLAHIRQDMSDGAATVAGGPPEATKGSRDELKSVRYFRRTWSRLSVDRQLSRAFAVAPENAGPLNSHFLVLQALRLMRDVSPEYLEQFMSYADALLWLEQADSTRPAAKNTPRPEREKKRK